MYKPSEYNIITEASGGYVLYNAISKSLNYVSSDEMSNIKKCFGGEKDHQYIPVLVNKGYLVGQDSSERLMADMVFFKQIFDSRLELTIMPTEDCNFRCKYCYETFEHGKMSPEMVQNVIDYVRKNMRNYTSMSVSWFGGEPLEAADVIDTLSQAFIRFCMERKIPYAAGITTNGYNLDQNVLEMLLKNRVNTIQFTLDGLAETHDKYKVLKDGSPTHEVVLHNLRNIRDNCKKRLLDVVIRTNVSKEMLGRLDEIIAFYDSEFGQDPRFSFFFRPVGDWGGEAVKDINDSVFGEGEYNPVYETLLKNNTNLNYKMYHNELVHDINICYANRMNSYVFGSDGMVYKCTNKFDYDVNKIGTLGDKGILSINEDKATKWTLQGCNTSAECNRCKLLPACHAASCTAAQLNGDKSEPTCPHMKHNITTLMKLVSKNRKLVPTLF